MSTNQFTYTATITFNLLQGATVVHNGNPVVSYDFEQQIQTILSRPIQWDQKSIPQSLSGITVPQFENSGLWQSQGLSSITTLVSVNGQQSGSSAVTVDYTVEDGRNIFHQTIQIPGYRSIFYYYDWSNDGPININNAIPAFRYPTKATFINNAPYGDYPDAYNVNFVITMQIRASISCTGSMLDSSVCVDLCTASPDAITTCTNPYVNYCTPEVIARSSNCQTFLENAIQQRGPIPALDKNLKTYCAAKYKTFEGLTASGVPDIDLEICACHLPDTQYQNLQTSLIQEFPGLATYSQRDLCFFPACVSSRFPAVPIRKGGCDIPKCLQIAVFNSDGTVENSNVTITQDCGGAGPTPPNPNPNPNPAPPRIPFWVALVLVVIFVLLAAILYAFS